MNKSADFIKEIHDKNINFLIGSGASHGALQTLKMKIKNEGIEQSFEDIASRLIENGNDLHSYLLFYEYYYKQIIEPAYSMNFDEDPNVMSVLANYQKLLSYILGVLDDKRVDDHKRCNIFTTNYDGFFEEAAERFIRESRLCILNDGGFGFKSRILNASNFNLQVKHLGVFDSYSTEISMINLIKLHGSIYWKKENDNIAIDYQNKAPITPLELGKPYNLDRKNEYREIEEVTIESDDQGDLKKFWKEYKQIPIVNPTKWKFNETVFEQHYYQMLRLLSYELEKKDAYLIVFGFSFKDEHIYDLVKRSLLNKHLAVYIFCYDEKEYEHMKAKFSGYKNVFLVNKCLQKCIGKSTKIELLDFSDFLNILKGEADQETWMVRQ